MVSLSVKSINSRNVDGIFCVGVNTLVAGFVVSFSNIQFAVIDTIRRYAPISELWDWHLIIFICGLTI